MNLIKESTTFVKVEKIFFVKTSSYKLGKYKVKDGLLKGKIDGSLEFFDSETKQQETKFNFDFNINVPKDIDVEDVKIIDLKFHTIDNLGVDCVYILEIFTKPRVTKPTKEKKQEIVQEEVATRPEDETVLKLDEEKNIVEKMKIQNAINEELKQELTNSYDKLLEESLDKREIAENEQEEGKELIEIKSQNADQENDSKEIEIIVLDEKINSQEVKDLIKEQIKNTSVSMIRSIIEEVQEENEEITEKRTEKKVEEIKEIIEIKNKEEKREEHESKNVSFNTLDEGAKLDGKNASNVEIISTISDSNEDEFIRFFNSFETKYFQIKTLYCQSEEDLNKISKDYNVSIETLLKSYDKKSRSVIIKDGIK